MSNYKITTVQIGNKTLEEVTDENGMQWYPLNNFMRNILHNKMSTRDFRDGYISKFMKVIEYSKLYHDKPYTKRVWYINLKGVKYILKNITIVEGTNKTTYMLRINGYKEACNFFRIKCKYKDKKFDITKKAPDLSKYDFWSKMCIESDMSICMDTRWVKCPECGYFYPDTDKYFADCNNHVCIECAGGYFKCKNELVQFIYEHCGKKMVYYLLQDNHNPKYDKKIASILRQLIKNTEVKK